MTRSGKRKMPDGETAITPDAQRTRKDERARVPLEHVRSLLKSKLAVEELNLFRNTDLDLLASNGFTLASVFAAADEESLKALLPGRLGLVRLLLRTFVQSQPPAVSSRDELLGVLPGRGGMVTGLIETSGKPQRPAEGEPSSKKANSSGDTYLFLDAVESEVAARSCYYQKLLEAPLELPKSVEEIRKFLATITEKLPLTNPHKYFNINLPRLVRLSTSAAESDLAVTVEFLFDYMSGPCPGNEATSSSELCSLTGYFLNHLNNKASDGRELRGLEYILDAPNPGPSKSASQALLPLVRPDFQLFVSDVLMLRWENKIDRGDMNEALEENASKLKVWSPLYYGTLPYVIGGCCARRQFRWLKLSPSGERIVTEIISDVYDLNMSSGVARFLHSIIRMHCLLQKLQQELGDHIPLKLYRIQPRNGGGEVVVYPDFVHKVLKPPLEKNKYGALRSLYASIKGSSYLIQLKHSRALWEETLLQLEPVGNPHARPGVWKDLAAAVHDVLHGLADLHKQGYTHRDLRWENIIKVNVESESKWVIIDLEAAGPDEEEWEGDPLTTWDKRTLEDRDGKRIYTKGSDMYQLGKLIVEWLDRYTTSVEEVQDLYRTMGEEMQRERPAATTVLEGICKSGCQRCGKFGRDKFRTASRF